MNTANLIRCGAMAQAKYQMKPNFKIMQLADDYAYPEVRIAIPPAYPDVWPDYDTVRLEKWATTDNYEMIYLGYSKMANTLVYRNYNRKEL